VCSVAAYSLAMEVQMTRVAPEPTPAAVIVSAQWWMAAAPPTSASAARGTNQAGSTA